MIFKFRSYLKVLNYQVGAAKTRTGQKANLAKAMGCQQTYLSKVLKGEADLNQEQALEACKHFHFSSEETDYFLLLLGKARAGTPALRKHYQQKINSFQSEILAVETQIDVAEHLDREDQQIYYSSIYYMAFHIAVSLTSINNVEDISREFEMERKEAEKILEFLLKTRLIVANNKGLEPGPTHIHLKNSAPDIIKNHTNWRLRALEVVTRPKPENFHYSVVASLSKKDATLLKVKMIEWVQEFLQTIEPSVEETIYCHTIDFFKVLKKS